jgi:hypothetical protein
MNRNVFLSILAMDAYQRGYAVGIDNVGGNKIGTATIGSASSIAEDSIEVAAGFYAQSYTWGSETVLSYRGTDFDVANDFVRSDGTLARIEKAFNSEFFKDLTRGWGTFLAAGLGTPAQFSLARQFYLANVGRDTSGEFDRGVVHNNITVTGHSLGGALAGYVDAHTAVNSWLVDPIPYGATAWVTAIVDAFKATLLEFGNIGWQDLLA